MEAKCRLCLSDDPELDASSSRIRAIIRNLFSILVKRDDSLTRICAMCLGKIEDFHSFYERVRENQTILEGGSKRFKIENDPEPKTEIEEDYQENVVDEVDDRTNDDLRIDSTFKNVLNDNSDCPPENGSKSHRFGKKKRCYECDECNKSFCVLNALKRHLQTHTLRGRYKCDQCSNMYATFKSRKQHIEIAHSMPKFLCTECGKGFHLECLLKIHSEGHNENKIRCEVCQSTFKNSLTLKRHMSIHGDKRFACDQCEYKTYNRVNLRSHAKIKHSEIKPYECETCGKRFKMKKSLNVHKVQHTGEHKYSCPFCAKTFAQCGNLIKHRRRMHREQYEEGSKIKFKENG